MNDINPAFNVSVKPTVVASALNPASLACSAYTTPVPHRVDSLSRSCPLSIVPPTKTTIRYQSHPTAPSQTTVVRGLIGSEESASFHRQMETLDKKLARGSKGKSRRVKELLPESQLREKVMRLYMTHWRNFLSEMALEHAAKADLTAAFLPQMNDPEMDEFRSAKMRVDMILYPERGQL